MSEEGTVTNALARNIRDHLVRADILYSWISKTEDLQDFTICGSPDMQMRDGTCFFARHMGRLYRITVEDTGEYASWAS